MANAIEAITETLKNEGGFTDEIGDPGGPTKFGITQADMPQIPIQTLTEGQAAQYYLENYWKPAFSEINSQRVANKIFDLGVLAGIGTVVKLIQQCANVTADGVFGPNTINAVNNFPEDVLLNNFRARLTTHFQNLANMNPNLEQFLKGWLNRVNS